MKDNNEDAIFDFVMVKQNFIFKLQRWLVSMFEVENIPQQSILFL